MIKKIKIGILLGLMLLVSACDKEKNNLDNATVYTTVYPVSFITEYLYGNNSKVESIYPNGVNIDEYTLTDKQIDNYSHGDLFVYIGLGKERDIAKEFLNKNKNLLIINATFELPYNNSIEELWLAPNNFLKLMKNIKNSLNEYLNNSLKEESVNKKYDELYMEVSWLGAELRNIAKEAKNNQNNVLVVASNKLKYLEHYGFEVISLQEISESGSENALNDIKNKFRNSRYTTILKLANEENSELVDELVNKNKAQVVALNDLVTNEDNSSNYITIQYDNIALIRDILLD